MSNRSFAWGNLRLNGRLLSRWHWKQPLFQRDMTGWAEPARQRHDGRQLRYSARLHAFPIGEWSWVTSADLGLRSILPVLSRLRISGVQIEREGRVSLNTFVCRLWSRLSNLLPEPFLYDVSLYSSYLNQVVGAGQIVRGILLRTSVNRLTPSRSRLYYDHGF